MKLEDIKNLPDDELLTEIDKLRKQIFKAKFQGKGSAVENSGAILNQKRDVARMLTILKERELERKKN